MSSSLQMLNTFCFIPRENAQCARQHSWLEEGGCLSYVLKNAPYLVSNGPRSVSHKNDKACYWVFLQTRSCRELGSAVGTVIFVGRCSERQRGFAWQNADGTPKPHPHRDAQGQTFIPGLPGPKPSDATSG